MSSVWKVLAGSLAAFIATSGTTAAAEYTAASASEIHAFASRLEPGDTIILADGTWQDQSIVFDQSGTAEAPLVLRAATPGKTVLTGRSSLRLNGQHVKVEGLWFHECVERKDVLLIEGNDCSVFDCAFTANRCKFFVRFNGKRNAMERCYLSGKTTDSPTLQIDVGEQPNENRIERNHFGVRQPLGRNGGETIRVGISGQSMKTSRTLVQENLFEGCDGEIEIISNKSCENIYRANTFRASAGTLTLRHGNRCIVEGNFFLGDGKPGSGGIRVIGEDHLVINNYLEGLDRAAIWITAGIVDSPLNGYFRAQRCLIAFNTVIQDRNAALELDAGFGSSGRTLRPSQITIANNLFVITKDGVLLRGEEGDGFKWLGNLVTGHAAAPGVRREQISLEPDTVGILRPSPTAPSRGSAKGDFPQVSNDIDGQPRNKKRDVGADEFSEASVRFRPLKPEQVGPAWLDAKSRRTLDGQ